MSSDLEDALLFQLRAAGLPEPEREYRFVPRRLFRADFAWPERKILLEVEGGIFRRDPSHSSISGIKRDIEKQNQAAILGYRVLRVHSDMVHDGSALALVERALGG